MSFGQTRQDVQISMGIARNFVLVGALLGHFGRTENASSGRKCRLVPISQFDKFLCSANVPPPPAMPVRPMENENQGRQLTIIGSAGNDHQNGTCVNFLCNSFSMAQN